MLLYFAHSEFLSSHIPALESLTQNTGVSHDAAAALEQEG